MRALLVSSLFLAACGERAADAPPRTDDASVETSLVDATPETDAHVLDAAVDTGAYDGRKTLGETGLYSDFAAKTVAPDVFPYDVRYPLWSDGLEKSRFLLLPKGATIDTSDVDHWVLPVGTKIWKEFRLADGKRIETRYLEKRATDWSYVAFLWDDAQSNATAVPDGKTAALGTTHDVPDRESCYICHAGVNEFVLGVGTLQLSRLDGTGPLADLAAKGWLSKPVAQAEAPGTGVPKQALGYFHGNCGHCHNDDGLWAKANPLRLRLHVSDTVPEKAPAYVTSINQKSFHLGPGDIDTIVVPGYPEKSQLWARMTRRDFWQMPPRGTNMVDSAGSELISAWITGLK